MCSCYNLYLIQITAPPGLLRVYFQCFVHNISGYSSGSDIFLVSVQNASRKLKMFRNDPIRAQDFEINNCFWDKNHFFNVLFNQGRGAKL